MLLYAAVGLALVAVFSRLSRNVEVQRGKSRDGTPRLLGLALSKGLVIHLSALFALDAFGGGFVVQSFAAYWFYSRFGVAPAALGGIFFGANLLAGLSALLAPRLASRIGLVKTMVFSHLPSNVLLILVPLMPNLRLAVVVLLLRFSISQMDVRRDSPTSLEKRRKSAVRRSNPFDVVIGPKGCSRRVLYFLLRSFGTVLRQQRNHQPF